MPGYEERASILQGEGAMIFNLVCDRATPKQWAEWLRAPLEHAAGTANADLVDKLLRAGAEGSAGWKGCHGQTLLHAGAEGGSEQVMSALVRTGAKEDINTKAQAKKHTPLHLAALGGKVAAAKVLMMAGADVNILDADNDSPLHLAIEGGHVGIAEFLVLRGADPEVKDSKGYFPIHLAARRGQGETVRNLLHTGVQVDRLDFVHEWTALVHAIWNDHLSTVRILLGKGADSAITCNGLTPLHTAAQRGKADTLAALAEAGADIEARAIGGFTPLYSSVLLGSCAHMLALLRLGANVHATIPTIGYTPLHYACIDGNLDAVDLLLRWGADETTLTKSGDTPSALIPKVSDAAEQDLPRLERLTKLLASAPQDRVWRRRGMLVLCRAHPDRLRLAIEIPDTAELGGQPQGRPNRRARRDQVKVEVTMGSAQNGGAGSSAGGGRRAAREGSGSGGGGGRFDGVAAWLVALTDEGVFRQIVGFL